MTGESQDLSRDQLLIRLDLYRQQVRELEEQLARVTKPAHAKPQLRVIRGGKAVIVVPAIWLGHTLRDHAAQAAAAAILVGVPSAAGGFIAGTSVAPAEAEPQAVPSISVESSRPGSYSPHHGVSSGVTPVPSVAPLPTGPPGAVESNASPAAATPLSSPFESVVTPSELPTLLPPLGVEEPPLTPTAAPTTPSPTPPPSPEPTTEPTPEPDPLEEIQKGRSTVVLTCVGQPGGEPPQDVVGCVDELLSGVS